MHENTGPTRRNKSHIDHRRVPTALVPILIVTFLIATGWGCRPYAIAGSGSAPTGPSSAKAAGSSPAKPVPIEKLEQRLFELTNQERSKRGLGRLEKSPSLKPIARTHSKHMCELGRLVHESKDLPAGWQGFSVRMDRAGLVEGGENVARVTYTGNQDWWVNKVMKMWMNSDVHRKNILHKEFQYITLGVHMCDDGIAYVTQLFSVRPGSRP